MLENFTYPSKMSDKNLKTSNQFIKARTFAVDSPLW